MDPTVKTPAFGLAFLFGGLCPVVDKQSPSVGEQDACGLSLRRALEEKFSKFSGWLSLLGVSMLRL